MRKPYGSYHLLAVIPHRSHNASASTIHSSICITISFSLSMSRFSSLVLHESESIQKRCSIALPCHYPTIVSKSRDWHHLSWEFCCQFATIRVLINWKPAKPSHILPSFCHRIVHAYVSPQGLLTTIKPFKISHPVQFLRGRKYRISSTHLSQTNRIRYVYRQESFNELSARNKILYAWSYSHLHFSKLDCLSFRWISQVELQTKLHNWTWLSNYAIKAPAHPQ